MSKFDDGGPAFPVPGLSNLPNGDYIHPECGMSLRQYAAIELRVPNSGTDWLDEMIRTSLRDELAAKAMQAIWSCLHPDAVRSESIVFTAKDAHLLADAMLASRGEEK